MFAWDVHIGCRWVPCHLHGGLRMGELVVPGYVVWRRAVCLRLADQGVGRVAEDTIRKIRRTNGHSVVDADHLDANQKGRCFVVHTWVQAVATMQIAAVAVTNEKWVPE